MAKNEQGTNRLDDNPYTPPLCTQDVPATSRRTRILEILICVAIVAVLAALLIPPVRHSEGGARREKCRNNLRQIGLALFNYEDKYGSFPPSYTVDADGKPLHSWRALLLPFIDQQELYSKIDLSKPWDDPVNQDAFNSSVAAYCCPSSKIGSNFTSYQAIVSNDSCFPPGRAICFKDITDDPGKTLLIVETIAEQSVPWMAPQDLDETQILSINTKTKFQHTGGFHALRADGSAWFISANTPKATLQALITRAANDTVSDD